MSAAAAQTAVGPIAIVALDQHEALPLVRNPLAAKMVTGLGRILSADPAARGTPTGTSNLAAGP